MVSFSTVSPLVAHQYNSGSEAPVAMGVGKGGSGCSSLSYIFLCFPSNSSHRLVSKHFAPCLTLLFQNVLSFAIFFQLLGSMLNFFKFALRTYLYYFLAAPALLAFCERRRLALKDDHLSFLPCNRTILCFLMTKASILVELASCGTLMLALQSSKLILRMFLRHRWRIFSILGNFFADNHRRCFQAALYYSIKIHAD